MAKTRIIKKEQVETIALVHTGHKDGLGLMFETTNKTPITENSFIIEVTIDALSSLVAYILKDTFVEEITKMGVFKPGGQA